MKTFSFCNNRSSCSHPPLQSYINAGIFVCEFFSYNICVVFQAALHTIAHASQNQIKGKKNQKSPTPKKPQAFQTTLFSPLPETVGTGGKHCHCPLWFLNKWPLMFRSVECHDPSLEVLAFILLRRILMLQINGVCGVTSSPSRDYNY